MRIIAKFEKLDNVRFISHLDIQRLFQRAFRRADVPVAHSNGFNPHSLLSFATALSVGYTSSAEWLDIKLCEDMDAANFVEAVNLTMPQGIKVTYAKQVDDGMPTLASLMQRAKYSVRIATQTKCDVEIALAIARLMDGSIVVNKRTKAGMKDVDIRPMLYDMSVAHADEGCTVVNIEGCLDAAGSLNVELLLKSLFDVIGRDMEFTVHRDEIIFADEAALPSGT
ncbi:MAG: TIGR03936 family radical SAM-associated protein [Clostridia bacterium]